MYPFKQVEKKWQKIWENLKTYKATPNEKPKKYILEMLPYPSGRLHMGHVRNYTIADVIARFYYKQGFNVLHPMGWDAFGLPAENAAIQNKASPSKWTYSNIKDMRQQLKSLGFSYDWGRELATCHPGYYGHEQKLFLDFYKKGLLERKESWVNWDPVENTVLANEQVVDGLGWRSGVPVERKKLNQWSLKIILYAEELLGDLQKLTKWPERVTKMQENWIGKSEGAIVHFKVVDSADVISVFTTCPETLFGASFCALSPDHPLAEKYAQQNSDLKKFIQECRSTGTSEEAISLQEKKGFFIGYTVVHPFGGKPLPVYVANFVLMEYGTGAIFGCPAHDERDFEFAQKYNLHIQRVVIGDTLPYTGEGIMVGSDFLNELSRKDAKKAAIKKLVETGQGEEKTVFRLRNWGISRQRYWGCPIPMVHCQACGTVPVPENQLPIELPDDVDFSKPGNPLDYHPTWKHVDCPECGQKGVRETDTLDTFFESSWYFLRYCNPYDPSPIPDEAKHWMPVDFYVGGIEHAVMHLLYARFFMKALRDSGYLNLDEPFKELLTQGMVCHETYKGQTTGEWFYPHEITKDSKGVYQVLKTKEEIIVGRSEKMSKSKKNTVDPQDILEAYGADVARLFVVSDTPPEKDFDWNDEGIEGCWRFLNRVWRMADLLASYQSASNDGGEALLQKTHQTLAKAYDGFEKRSLNKVIAFIREFSNLVEECLQKKHIPLDILKDSYATVLQLLNPFCPHITSEIWENLDLGESISTLQWPIVDMSKALTETVTIAVQVNGKMKGSFESARGLEQDDLFQMARDIPQVQKELDGKIVKRLVVVPDRLINICVG